MRKSHRIERAFFESRAWSRSAKGITAALMQLTTIWSFGWRSMSKPRTHFPGGMRPGADCATAAGPGPRADLHRGLHGRRHRDLDSPTASRYGFDVPTLARLFTGRTEPSFVSAG